MKQIRDRHCLLGGASLALVALVATSCTYLPAPRAKPKAEVKFLQPTTNAVGEWVSPATLQAEVMRFADQYAITIQQALDELSARVNTPEGRRDALKMKLGQATAAYVDAAGQNPLLNALDMVVLATLSRIVTEDHVVGDLYGELALPLLETNRRLETNAWSLVARVLKPEQQQELRDMIRDWRVKHPNQRYVAAFRFREFASTLENPPQARTTKPTSLFSLLFIDPMAGLDPAARAIEQTQYQASLLMYYLQRMPTLLRWQVELMALEITDQPAPKQLLAQTERMSKATETFASAAERFPQIINDQREAAIDQLLAGLAAERSNILASLASEEKKFTALLAETRATLTAGNETASSVNAAVQSLDAFVRSVSPGARTNLPPRPVSTNSRPFDVLDYGKAAAQVGAAAQDLNTLLTSVNQTVPQIARLGQQTGAEAERVVHRAFWLGLVLVLVALAGSVLAVLAYQVLAAKLFRAGRPPSAGTP